MNTQKLSIIVVFAALYAVGVIAWPMSSYQPQVRIADALLPLSMIFGLPSILGLGLGTLVANVFGGLGMIDIIGGTFANLIACTLAWYIVKRGKNFISRFVGVLVETIIVSLIVGFYLAFILSISIELSLIGIFVGSIIAITILGFAVEEAIYRSGLFTEQN